MYRMKTMLNKGENVHTRSNFPSEHDFEIISQLTIDVLALIDKARKTLDSDAARESIFHLRGYWLTIMEPIRDFVRPRR